MVQRNGLVEEEEVAVIESYSDVFAVTDVEFTQRDLVVHEIDTSTPIGASNDFKGIIKDLVEEAVVEKSPSDRTSLLVLVNKKTEHGILRLCIDYRELNRQPGKAPTHSRLLILCYSLSGKNVNSTINLASAYWQIKLTEDAKRKSAFRASEGLFQFTMLLFGLSTSPVAFFPTPSEGLSLFVTITHFLDYTKSNMSFSGSRCLGFSHSSFLHSSITSPSLNTIPSLVLFSTRM